MASSEAPQKASKAIAEQLAELYTGNRSQASNDVVIDVHDSRDPAVNSLAREYPD